MRATKPQPITPDDAERRAAAFGAWMMSSVRREIAAGGVRQTIDDNGAAATLH
jgi:hypothetical protein